MYMYMCIHVCVPSISCSMCCVTVCVCPYSAHQRMQLIRTLEGVRSVCIYNVHVYLYRDISCSTVERVLIASCEVSFGKLLIECNNLALAWCHNANHNRLENA